MTRIFTKKTISSFLTGIFICICAHAEFYSLESLNLVLDLPESFSITQAAPDGTSFFFETKLMPVKTALKIYSSKDFQTSKDVLQNVMEQLQCKTEIEQFDWYDRDTSLCTFSFKAENTVMTGWALAAKQPEKEKYAVLLAYCDQMISEDCQQFTLSVMDSIYLCNEDFRRLGPVSFFAYARDMGKTKSITLNINATEIKTEIDELACEIEEFTLEREWAVLTLYASHPSWKEAWQRYYRQLFKQSYSLLDTASRDIYTALFRQARKADSKNPGKVLAQYLLSWTQTFEYKRDTKKTDFTPLCAAVSGEGSDCDSRSLLMCVLCEHIGIKSELFISREYSHAVCGLELDLQGAAITVNNKKYVIGETTAKVDLGRIAQTQSDTTKWIEVDLP